MTSAVLGFCEGFCSKMEEKVAGDCSVGIGVVTEIGLCIEKNEETWISVFWLARRSPAASYDYLPRGCTWPVEGTLGRFKDKSLLFDLRLLAPELGRFSITSWAADLGFLEGASDGVAMALDSSLGELEVFEEECLR